MQALHEPQWRRVAGVGGQLAIEINSRPRKNTTPALRSIKIRIAWIQPSPPALRGRAFSNTGAVGKDADGRKTTDVVYRFAELLGGSAGGAQHLCDSRRPSGIAGDVRRDLPLPRRPKASGRFSGPVNQAHVMQTTVGEILLLGPAALYAMARNM